MKYFSSLLCVSLFCAVASLFAPVFADETPSNLKIDFDDTIYIQDPLSIDISEKIPDYEQELGQENLSFEWDITWKPTVEWPVLNESFEEPWDKQITLNVFSRINDEKTLLMTSDFSIFVYQDSLPFIFSDTIPTEKKQDFINLWKNSWLYIYEILDTAEQDIYGESLLTRLGNYALTEKWKSNYIGIWWEKEFLFSIISKINREQESIPNQRHMRFLLVSPFNGTILEWYLWNLLTNKDYISDAIILNDTLTFQIIKNPTDLDALKNQLNQNEYPYIQVDTKQEIRPYLILSRFVNTLSNIWVNTSDIYMLIIIPLLLTLISFMKHFVGISPVGIVIPLFLSVLFYKIGVSFTFIVLITLFFINLIVSQFINKYNLLYTPKISFLMIINIICFFVMLEVATNFKLITMDLTDVTYIMMFIIISEKLIALIVWKEVREYSKNLLGTIFIGFLWFLVMLIPILQIILLAYPELIILLVPLNFLMGRFTWLRMTEYFRFKEVIRNIEEE